MSGLNLFDMIQKAGGLNQVAGQFGLDESQAQGAVKALLPAISGGLKRNAGQPGGLEALMGALNSGQHQKYIEEPETLRRPETVADGNAILGHLLGSKDMSRKVASQASQRSGVDDGILKQMLPVVAAMAMGSLSKQSKEPNIAASLMGALSGGGQAQGGASGLMGMVGSLLGGGRKQQQQAGPNLGMLGSLLDADGDGNPMDDIMNMVMKR